MTVHPNSVMEGFDEKLISMCQEIPLLSSRLTNESLQIKSEAFHEESDIFLGDPSSIVSALNNASESLHVSDSHRLKWIHSTFAGVNEIYQNSTRNDFVLTRTSGFGSQMAEYCLGWSLFHYQRMEVAQSLQQQKTWDRDAFVKRGGINGICMGVMGVGDIGSAVAKAAKAFQMTTIGLSSSSESAASNRDENFDKVTASLHELLCVSDIVVNTLPSTDQTKGLLTLHKLNLAFHQSTRKNPPLFINIGRGDIISTSHIISALDGSQNDGQPSLSYAILDVFEEEPLPQSSPLWNNPRVSITPHISAISTPEIVGKSFLFNLERFVRWWDEVDSNTKSLSETLHNVAHRSKGY